MERKSQTKKLVKIFTVLIKRLVMPEFSFPNPNGGIAKRTISNCLDELEKHYGCEISDERLIDFCVCQAYAASKYEDFKKMWSVQGGFGKKALERFKVIQGKHKYFEDRWLSTEGLTRGELINMVKDRSEHPQAPYIYVAYEDNTKNRALNTPAGYAICGMSTLLWSPKSPVCQKCESVASCKLRTKALYPELYRLRIEEEENNESE